MSNYTTVTYPFDPAGVVLVQAGQPGPPGPAGPPGSGGAINDAATATTSTWSSSKTSGLLAGKLDAAAVSSVAAYIPTTGAPSSGMGNTGDGAIDAAALTVYGAKDASTGWPSGTQLASAAALAAKADLVGGKVPQAQIPSVALTDFLGAVASQAAMLALTGQRGDWCTRTDLGTDWQLIADDPTQLANWRQHVYPASPVSSVAGRTGAITLSTADVSGLSAPATAPFGTTTGTVADGGTVATNTTNIATNTTNIANEITRAQAAELAETRTRRLRAQIRDGVPCTDVTFVSCPEAITIGSSAGTGWAWHTVHYSGVGFWLVIPNKRMNQGTTAPNYQDTDPAASLTIKVSWRIKSSPSGVVAGPLMAQFGGVVSATVDPSGDIRTDFIPQPLEAGSILDVRVYTAAASWQCNLQSNHSGNNAGFVSATDSTLTAGDLATSTGRMIQPAMVLLKPPANLSAPLVAVGATGMSIQDGQGDDYSLANGYNTKTLVNAATGGGGYLGRAFKTAGIPLVQFSLPGDLLANTVTAAKRYARSRLLPYMTDIVMMNPTNDYAGGASLATMQANWITSIGQFGTAGYGYRLWADTITPRTSSTDNWATTANQSPAISAGAETIRVNWNTWLRDGAPMHASGSTWVADPVGTTGSTIARCAYYGTTGALVTAASGPTHPVAGVWENADTVESARNSGKWAAGTALTGITTTASSQAVTAATNQFTSSMVGGIIVIPGAGAAGATLVTTILSYTSATAVTIATAATTAVAGGTATANVLTNDGVHPCPLGHALMAPAVPTAAIAVSS